MLDLYVGRWEGRLLHPGDCVISADEKPSIQARRRVCETLPPAAGVPRGQRVEHTYKRGGALCTTPPGTCAVVASSAAASPKAASRPSTGLSTR